MENEQKIKYQDLNKFLRSIHMGTQTFKVYKDKAEDESLIDLIDKALKVFRKHEKKVTELVLSFNIDPVDDLTIGNEFIILMEKMKMPKSDFDIGIYAMKGINMGLTNGLEFIHEHIWMDEEVKEKLKEVIDDYSSLMNSFNNHLQEYYI